MTIEVGSSVGLKQSGKYVGLVVELDGGIAYIEQDNGVECEYPESMLKACDRPNTVSKALKEWKPAVNETSSIVEFIRDTCPDDVINLVKEAHDHEKFVTLKYKGPAFDDLTTLARFNAIGDHLSKTGFASKVLERMVVLSQQSEQAKVKKSESVYEF